MKTDDTFLDACFTPMYRVFSDIYNMVLRKNVNAKYILREFQVAVSQVHKWTMSKQVIEFEKATDDEKRIQKLIMVNMRAAIKHAISPGRVKYAMEELPNESKFYHMCLVEISREMYRYPSLMYHNVDTFTRRKNRENIKEVVYGAISKVLVSIIPVLSDTESEDESEALISDKRQDIECTHEAYQEEENECLNTSTYEVICEHRDDTSDTALVETVNESTTRGLETDTACNILESLSRLEDNETSDVSLFARCGNDDKDTVDVFDAVKILDELSNLESDRTVTFSKELETNDSTSSIIETNDTAFVSVESTNDTGDVIIDIDVGTTSEVNYIEGVDSGNEKKNGYLCMRSLSELIRNGVEFLPGSKKRFDERSRLSYEPFSESDSDHDIVLDDHTDHSESSDDEMVDTKLNINNVYEDLTSDEDICDTFAKTSPISIPNVHSNIKNTVR